MFQLDTARIKIISGTDAEVLRQSTMRFRTEADELESKLNATTSTLKMTQNRLDSVQNIPAMGENLLKEITKLYPQISTCSYSETIIYADTTQTKRIPMVVFTSDRVINRTDRNKISEWVQTRLENKETKTLFE